MLKIFIGPNGYGKTYELERIKKSLFNQDNDRKDVIMLWSELVFDDEMKYTINNSFLMDYIITELLVDEELTKRKLDITVFFYIKFIYWN